MNSASARPGPLCIGDHLIRKTNTPSVDKQITGVS